MYHTVSLVHTTPDAEKLIAYMARVSNPDNQDNPESERLIR
jgi:thymidylate synthase (FAD)